MRCQAWDSERTLLVILKAPTGRDNWATLGSQPKSQRRPHSLRGTITPLQGSCATSPVRCPRPTLCSDLGYRILAPSGLKFSPHWQPAALQLYCLPTGAGGSIQNAAGAETGRVAEMGEEILGGLVGLWRADVEKGPFAWKTDEPAAREPGGKHLPLDGDGTAAGHFLDQLAFEEFNAGIDEARCSGLRGASALPASVFSRTCLTRPPCPVSTLPNRDVSGTRASTRLPSDCCWS